MYLRVQEIFALAADYQPSIKETNLFFSQMQNKLHFAVSGKTAAELIYERANADLPQMGLTHTATLQRVYQKDVKVAKLPE